MTVTLEQLERGLHECVRSQSWEVYDAQRIYLCRVCAECEAAKLSRYRPEILSGYNQADVDEPIEPDYPEDYGRIWGSDEPL